MWERQATHITVSKEKGHGAYGHGTVNPGTKVKVIATPEVAHRIMKHLAEHYFNRYPMLAFLDDVEVPSGERAGDLKANRVGLPWPRKPSRHL